MHLEVGRVALRLASLGGWPTLAVTLAAFGVGSLAFGSDRSFRTRDALSKLLERFEVGGFHVFIWRMEQVTRPVGAAASSIERIKIDEFKGGLSGSQAEAKKTLIEEVLAQEWSSQRAVMHELYFFALSAHAWLVATPLFVRRRIMLLNDAFGYQLLSTLLDHRIVAARLDPEAREDSYFLTQYGCFDPACLDLVNRLARELLRPDRKWSPPQDIRDALSEKWRVTEEHLALVAGETPAETAAAHPRGDASEPGSI